ncbi:MAG: hypothetical protein V4757_03680 [Pseudomonadota bacterium]
MAKELSIKLDTNFSMFTVAVHPGFQYLGRIQRGMEVGALALTPQGEYVQVNGSVVTPLNTSRVLSTLRKLQGRHGALAVPRPDVAAVEDEMPFTPPPAPPAAVPVIVRRKKRIAVMP